MRVNAFYDANGQLDLLTWHISYSGTLSSPLSGKSVPHIGHATLTINPQRGVALYDSVGLYTQWTRAPS